LFVPLSSLLVLAVLAAFPALYNTPTPGLSFPYAEIIIGISLWVLAYELGPPLFTAVSVLPIPTHLATVISACLHATLRNGLRVVGVAALGIASVSGSSSVDDPAFMRVWAFALGCGAADAIAGAVQGHAQLALYRDVLVSPADARALVAAWLRGRTAAKARAPDALRGASGSSERRPLRVVRQPSTAEARLELERDLDALVAFKTREDLEELYGMHVIVRAIPLLTHHGEF
jgi:hypothetical protein